MGIYSQVGNGKTALLLDDLSASTNFGWSAFQLSESQTLCIQIIRASDSATLDIGFVSGYIDTAAITTFASGTTYKIVTFYNAIGYNNATDTLDSRRETGILTGGVDSKFSIDDSGDTYNNLHYALDTTITDTQASEYISVVKKPSVSGNGYGFCASVQIYGRLSYNSTGLRYRDASGTKSQTGLFTTNGEYLARIRRDSSDDILMGVDGTETNTGSKSTLMNMTHLRGSRSSSNFESLLLQFPSTLSSDDWTKIKTWYNLNFNKSI